VLYTKVVRGCPLRPNASVLLRVTLLNQRHGFARTKYAKGAQPNDYHALVCCNYR